MNSMSTLFLLLALICASSVVVVARDLKGPKSSKAPTTKSTKGPKMSKKTKSPAAAKGSKLSTKAPTTKSTKSSKKAGGATFVSIGPVNFDDLAEDEVLDVYRTLKWTGWRASLTLPEPTSVPRAAVADLITSSVALETGQVFSLSVVDIAGTVAASPVIINGFDENGVLTVTKVIAFTNQYFPYDVSEFVNVARVDFTFGDAPAAAIDDFVFL